ncbi:RICIN domain-containing protein [Sorangium sp. So ce1000]|uniref:RICIN domain-containing protein n=1 Tax=Sorangium sp. So ce1000 TaxID=3133325 RepID=UPI003F63A67E
MIRGFFSSVLAAGVVACGAIVACSSGDEPALPSVGTATSPATCRAGCSKDLYIVAHQDDDLLFMNPDLHGSITAGNTVRTIYVTAGDNHDFKSDLTPPYYVKREDGIKAAYAQMAGVQNSWTDTSITIMTTGGQKAIVRYTLQNATNVSLVFLRLPNAYDPPHVAPVTKIEQLWSGAVTTLTAKGGGSEYTKRDLLEVLTSLIEGFAPHRLAMLDHSNLYNSGTNADHHDHIYSARFAFEAHRNAGGFGARRVSLYRGYNILNEYNTTTSSGSVDVGNLSAAEDTDKLDIFDTYGCLDERVSCSPSTNYRNYVKRQIAMSSLSGAQSGRPVYLVQSGLCLEVVNGVAQNGTNVQAGACSGAARQQWEIYGGQVHFKGTTKCLDVDGGNYGDNGNWFDPVLDGRNVQIWECADVRAERWTIFTNGQVRGVQGKCLDLDPDTHNARVWDCEPGRLQDWTVELNTVTSWSSEFSDSPDIDYGSFRLGDVNGDGRADACVRRSDGLHCALANSTSTGFDPLELWTAELADAGWLPADHGSTLQLADLDHDGDADVCGRADDGIRCMLSNGAWFEPSTLWTPAFANGGGWDTDVSRYGSIRLGDVDGDGRADVCGRASGGIVCALSVPLQDHFDTATTWLSTEFTDAKGWSAEAYGTTIQLGDIDGDGRADVCGRGLRGIHCAVSDGDSFIHSHWWSQDFSDAAGWGAQRSRYGSLRLADFDGDGFADLCGRAASGLVCAFSQGGTSFDRIRPIMPREYTDALNWDEDRYGTSLQFARLNTDGRADVCGRGTLVLRCGLAP